MAEPAAALRAMKRVLRRGQTITVIEGDHGSWYCHPQTPESSRAVQCLVDVQARFGGDSLIGRRLYPLLTEAGFRDVRVSPRMVYVDDSRPDLVEGFSKNTFIAMVEGVRDQALSLGLVDRTHVGERHRGSVPCGGARRDLLLHVLQGHSLAIVVGQTLPSVNSRAVRNRIPDPLI